MTNSPTNVYDGHSRVIPAKIDWFNKHEPTEPFLMWKCQPSVPVPAKIEWFNK